MIIDDFEEVGGGGGDLSFYQTYSYFIKIIIVSSELLGKANRLRKHLRKHLQKHCVFRLFLLYKYQLALLKERTRFSMTRGTVLPSPGSRGRGRPLSCRRSLLSF